MQGEFDDGPVSASAPSQTHMYGDIIVRFCDYYEAPEAISFIKE